MFYASVALVVVAFGMIALEAGMTYDMLAVLDMLFLRVAVAVFLYLLWRFVRAYERKGS